jgi:cytoskeleton protein RodZ
MARGIFGERLKRERELREVTLEEVAKSTRISERFLQALENEDWGKLPGGIFGRGFVRTVARYLGLNEEALLAEYDNARSEVAPSSPARVEERIPSPPKWISALIVFAILFALAAVIYAGVYGWRRYVKHRAASHTSSGAQPPAASQDSLPPALQTPSHAGLDLSVSTSAPAHVRIVADGALLYEGDLAEGQTRHFQAAENFEVSASDSSSVLLELNGQAMPPLGEPGASGTMVISRKDLRPATSGSTQR